MLVRVKLFERCTLTLFPGLDVHTTKLERSGTHSLNKKSCNWEAQRKEAIKSGERERISDDVENILTPSFNSKA